MFCRSRVLVFGLVLLLAPASRGAAQPSIRELRADLAEVSQARPAAVPEGALTSIHYTIDVAERIEDGFETASISWRARAGRYLEAVHAGRDPYVTEAGRITSRGYVSPISEHVQGYTIYLPPGYDPSRRYPLLIALHGGSSNGNLFLGVVLGNNMDWLTYNQHLWDDYEPRWSPDWIVVAPDGFGQVLWRWMGERDVLDVLDDVQRHYSVDPQRVVLNGLSNGGVGAYAIGLRHAWRFSQVHAMAGAPSWVQYVGGSPTADETTVLRSVSGMHLAENSLATDFRFYHGHRDGGPMRPAYVHEMEEQMRRIGIEPQVRWYDHGHDLLYLVHRHGRAYDGWAQVVRDPRPARVRVVSGDYRAARQHWVELTRIDEYPRIARADASFADDALTVTTERVLALSLHMGDVPSGGESIRLVVDGAEIYAGPRARLGHVAHARRAQGVVSGAWELGFPHVFEGRLEKTPQLSGPLTDPYFDGMIHVYGTQDAEATAALRRAAEQGARGWPLWLWRHSQRVVADSDVTPEMARDHHLVLYGTPGANAVLERIADRLPIRVSAAGVQVGSTSFSRRGVGTRFVYPNPESPARYVIVQAAPTPEAVSSGHNLPDFLLDWVVYDAASTRTRPRLISGRAGQPAAGFFDRFWQLEDEHRCRPEAGCGPEGGDDGPQDAPAGSGAGPDGAGDAPSAGGTGTGAGGTAAATGARVDAGVDAGADGGADGGADASVPSPLSTPEPRGAAARHAWLLARLGAPEDFELSDTALLQTPSVSLPVPDAPPLPARRRRFRVSRSDPAGAIARTLARRVPGYLNWRAIIRGGEWRVDRRASWSIQAEADCLAALTEAGVPHTALAPLTTPVPTPVQIDGPIDGVELRTVRPEDAPIVLSCEMALRLPLLAAIARRHHVRAIDVLSHYRTTPIHSFHRHGLALDLFAFETDDGELLSVLDDFEETPDHDTCDAPRRSTSKARALLDIACRLASSRRFSSVLTPNYNDGHRNHFHIDARPDDTRIFVR